MGYITPKNFSKTPANTLQKPSKHTSKHPPKPSQNTPKLFPKLLVFSFFSSGGGRATTESGPPPRGFRFDICFLTTAGIIIIIVALQLLPYIASFRP